MSAALQAELNKAHRLLASGRRADAVTILRSLLKAEAKGTIWGNIALLLMRLGDYDSSAVAGRRFLADSPDNIEATSLLANVLANIGKLDEAIALATRVCKKLPRNPAAHYNLGIYLSRDGRNERAIKSFSEAVSLDPGHALSLEYLAYLDPGESADRILEQIDTCLASVNRGDRNKQAALQYAKAVLLDRQQDWDRAFAAYEAGAGLMKDVARTDLDAFERYMESARESFSAKFFAANADARFENKRPIFIIGMPRSGTTLVESVFASHSKVTPGGETKLTGLATMRYDPFDPRALTQIESEIGAGKKPWADMGRELRRLQNQRYGKQGMVTEKNLGHHFLLGAIAMIASGARIIYCTRDPVATAWSCFKIRFSNGNGWSYDFESIGRYQRLYRETMSHWQRVLPDAPILEVAYEDLVGDPAHVIPTMLAHAGLAMEPGCLSPHRAEMAVMTASVMQVREPIRTDANLAWRNYEAHLAPYLDDLALPGDADSP